jgi:hypothetical protein
MQVFVYSLEVTVCGRGAELSRSPDPAIILYVCMALRSSEERLELHCAVHNDIISKHTTLDE